jgi:hypothetical protein
MKSLHLAAFAAIAALGLAAAATAVGPWPGLARSVTSPSGELRYTATRAHGATTVRALRGRNVVAAARFSGAYGIPAVTSSGQGGGLSPDGRLLVLGEPTNFQTLRQRSRFLVLAAPGLTRRATIVLDGEFGFDALSPDGRTLYLLQHAHSDDLFRYVVRAYDLRTKRLSGAIVDKREPDEAMRGVPVARATSARGVWVYTLYDGMGHPFVHALNTAKPEAFCIDLPWSGDQYNIWTMRLQLSADGRQLVLRTPSGAAVATIDTETLRVR